MEIINLDSDQSTGQPLIKEFAKTYTSPNITIDNKGTSDLYILDIYCEQKDFIKDKSSEKNIILVTEAGNSVTSNDLKQQYPKKILPESPIKIDAGGQLNTINMLVVVNNKTGTIINSDLELVKSITNVIAPETNTAPETAMPSIPSIKL